MALTWLWRTSAIVGLALSFSGAMGRAEAPDEQKALFNWFDTLGYKAVVTGQFVRVSTWLEDNKGKKLYPRSYQAFLVERTGARFTVLTLDLQTNSYPPIYSRWGATDKASFEPEDLRAWAEKWAEKQLAILSKPVAADISSFASGRTCLVADEAFVLARACAARGMAGLASALFEQAKSAPGHSLLNRDAPFAEVLKERIAEGTIWRDILAFDDLSVSRERLLAMFRDFLAKFPETEHEKLAVEAADMLAQMGREDLEHAKKPQVPVDQLPVRERVGELIFQLRDQNGEQWSQPGYPSFFADARGDASPASQLVKIGMAAAPQLVELLSDKQLTRTIAFGRSFRFSHRVLRVRDAARQVLERIAHREFNPPQNSSTLDEEKDAGQVQVEARAWLAGIDSKGERAVLVEAVRAGCPDGAEQAERLADAFPADAPAAIAQGAKAVSDSWVVGQMVRSLIKVHSPEAQAVARDLMLHGTALCTRVAGAQVVACFDADAAASAMVVEWRHVRPDQKPGGGGPDLVKFLAGCARALAVEALDDGLSKRSGDTRLRVIEAFQCERLPPDSYDGFPKEGIRPHDEESIRACESAVERLLIGRLSDTWERLGMSGGMTLGGQQFAFHDPRLCDLAAMSLSSLWPKKYHFTNPPSLRSRNAQLLTFANRWRLEHHLPARMPPTEPRKYVLVQGVLSRRLSDLARAKTTDAHAKAISALIDLGLPALSGVLEKIADAGPLHPQPDLEAVARSLSCIVAEVRAENAPNAAGQLVARASSLKGKVLTTESFLDLIRYAGANWPSDAKGVRFLTTRDDDGSGVTLLLVFGAWPSGGSGGQWNTREAVSVGRECILNSSGTSSGDFLFGKDGLRRFGTASHKALESSPLEVLDISFALEPGR